MLDMSLAIFKACVAGYEDRLFDLQVVSVYSGYWSGYYSNSRKPKKLDRIIQMMETERLKSRGEKTCSSQKHSNTIDVESFIAQDNAFKTKYAQQQ